MRGKQRCLRVPQRPRPQAGTAGSLLGQASDHASAHLVPWFAGRLTAHDAPGATLDFTCPSSLNLRLVFKGRIIKAGQ